MKDSLETVQFLEGQTGVYILFFGGGDIPENQKIHIKWVLRTEYPNIVKGGVEYAGVKCSVSTEITEGNKRINQGWADLNFWWRVVEEGRSDLWTADWRNVRSLEVKGVNFLDEMLDTFPLDYKKFKYDESNTSN